ncbi:MAG: hypothetical protein AAFV95_16185 [Bacteroidota bacterium]
MPELRDFQDVFPASQVDKFEAGRRLDILQPLQALGYLRSQEPGPAEWQSAIGLFRAEGVADGWLDPLSTDLAHAPADDLNGLELNLLHQAISFEGEMPIEQMPRREERSLFTRVIHFRLHKLGLYTGAIEAPWQESSLQGLHQLCQWFQLSDHLLKATALSGDLRALIRACVERGKLAERVVVFENANSNLPLPIVDLLQEESEEEDNEKQLNRLEDSLDGSLKDVGQQLLAQEENEAVQMEQPLTNREARLERIRLLMQRILDQLAEEFQDSLREEQRLLDELAQATDNSQRKKLDRAIRRLRRRRNRNSSAQQKKLVRLQRRLKQLSHKLNGLKFRFKAKLKKCLTEASYRQIRRQVFEQKNPLFLRSIAQDDFNQFLIRLIQLHQWTNGYYVGKTDGDFGQQTFESIVQMVKDLKKVRLKYILVQIKSDAQTHWVLNIAYLLERFVKHQRKQQHSADIEDFLSSYEKAFDEHPNVLTNELTEKTLNDVQEERRRGVLGHLYQGIGSLVHAGLRVMRRIVWFIKKGVAWLTNVFRNIIRVAYKMIREGFRQYGIGIALIVLRNYLPDLNTSTVSKLLKRFNIQKLWTRPSEGEQPPESDLSPKQQFALNLAVRVIQWGIALATGSFSWPALLIRIAIYFKKLLKEWLVGRQQHPIPATA